MNSLANKIFMLGLILLGLGVLFFILENLFYQYIDNTGVLHESIFMPLGVISLLLGALVFILFIVQKVIYWFNTSS